MRDEYFWVIGGGILQVPLIEQARSLGLKVIVTDGSKSCICSDLADIFQPIDIFDIAGHLSFAKSITDDIKIRGVLAAGIDAPETMSKVSEYFNLPAVPSKIAHLVNHKELFRQEMERLGIPVPIFHVITEHSLNNLDNIVMNVGYPLIVKNTSSSGSRGTKIFYEPDLRGIKETAIEAIEVSRSSKALIESLWCGTEHTVETLFDIEGNFHECFITDRLFDKSEGFAMETGLVHPTILSEEKQKEMYALAKFVSKSLGISIGASKFDMMMTDEGPRIIEMTVRLSGGFDCQYLVPAATGKNILKAAILTACGENFEDTLLEDTKKRICLSESIWPLPGVIESITGLEEIRSFSGFEFIYFRYNVGDLVEAYTDCTKRVCFVLVSGSNFEEATANMMAIKDKISIKIKK